DRPRAHGGGVTPVAARRGGRGGRVTVVPLRRRASAGRLGPGPVPEQLLRALEVTIARRMEGLLAGDYRSSLPGVGTELHQIRPYVPGDDVRRIDWAVTARTGEPHVRVHLAERVLVTWLVLDWSASMRFGTADRRKADVAEGVALALGHVATRRGNRLGLVSFGDGAPEPTPPRQGRVGLIGLLARLRQDDAGPDGATSLGAALHTTAAVARQHALVAIVSDFRGPLDWRRPLLDLAGRHDVLAVEVRDPREQELADVGQLTLADPETGSQLRVDTSDAGLRERFAAAAAAERAADARRVPAQGDEVTFSQPLALLALLALPALVALYLLHERRRRGAGARFANPALLPALADTVPRLRRHLPVALLLVALAAMIFGVARPHATVTVARKEATVVLAIDVSRSMRTRDVRPTRLQAALSTARGFVDELPETFRLGIVSVGSNAIDALPPTDDRQLARAALGALQRSEGTAIGDGIGLALDVARRQRADDGTMLPAAVLLVSDGANEGGRTQPRAAADRARALGVPVHTVLIGTPDGVVERALAGGFTERIRVP